MEHFFSKFEITQWNGVFNKQKQLPEVFFEKDFLEILKNSQENTCTTVSFNKVKAISKGVRKTIVPSFMFFLICGM